MYFNPDELKIIYEIRNFRVSLQEISGRNGRKGASFICRIDICSRACDTKLQIFKDPLPQFFYFTFFSLKRDFLLESCLISLRSHFHCLMAEVHFPATVNCCQNSIFFVSFYNWERKNISLFYNQEK